MESYIIQPTETGLFSLIIITLRFIHVVVLPVVHTFLLLRMIPLLEYMTVWPPVDGHLCCFQVWTAVN